MQKHSRLSPVVILADRRIYRIINGTRTSSIFRDQGSRAVHELKKKSARVRTQWRVRHVRLRVPIDGGNRLADQIHVVQNRVRHLFPKTLEGTLPREVFDSFLRSREANRDRGLKIETHYLWSLRSRTVTGVRREVPVCREEKASRRRDTPRARVCVDACIRVH